MDLHLNDRVELKKHPCGCKTGVITRVGMDIKWRCEGCGREIMLPRSKSGKKHQMHSGRRCRAMNSY